MTHICNKCLTTGMFLSRLSVAKVKYILKSADRKLVKLINVFLY